ncbi:MAG: Rieske 2Fe-2S domain-containing protein, partial [Chloroflexi bacterium]|nr:Rieske 2Fe-2S domain-containing protein [Chloroflexota bacterium]
MICFAVLCCVLMAKQPTDKIVRCQAVTACHGWYHTSMLSTKDNELLTRVGRGQPMGELLRRFWHPVLLSSELPKPDCPPVRVRLMGERLVAFRDTSGRVGLLAERCPHRRASLFFGRNEENGLRCIYHGWKYDIDGRCVDMPSEPAGSNFASKVRTTGYPCRETNGVVFAYLGPPELQPELPGIEWIGLPEGHVYVTKRYEFANWVQGLEGGIDSCHSNFLHTTVPAFRRTSDFFDGLRSRLQFDAKLVEYFINDLSPRFCLRDTDYGVMIGTQRDAEADSFYWRITHWLLPHANIFGGVRDDGSTRLGRGLIW